MNIFVIIYFYRDFDKIVLLFFIILEERIGFNNINFDLNGVICCYLLFIFYKNKIFIVFFLKLVIIYLKDYGILLVVIKNNEYKLGDVLFKELKLNLGGY